MPLRTSGLRFLAIKVGLPVWCERNEAHTALCRQRRPVRRSRCNTVAVQEPLTHGRPESATHQWVDFRQTIPLQYHHPAGPLARAVAKDATGNLSLVRIERR